MERINLQTHYTTKELSIILGFAVSHLYANYKEELNFKEYLLPSNRIGYGVFWKDFEDFLEASKTYDFTINEYNIYYEQKKKRPIQRQFLTIKETHSFLNAIGDVRFIGTIQRKVRENKIPSYMTKGKAKNLIPIIHLIKMYALPIDQKLEQLISEIIKAPYIFEL